MDIDPSVIRDALLNVCILIISLSLHEWGHAYTADRLGDDTPRMQGRVTLNLLPHIDILGTIIIPLLASFGFFGGLGVIGWAKPVYTDPRNFKNRVRDQALVTIAGPAMNFLIALVATFAAGLAYHFVPIAVPVLKSFMTLNVLLIVFNLLPIPPLDGSKFLMYWFGMSEEAYSLFAQWGWVLLLLLVNFPPFRYLLGALYHAALIPFAIILGLIAQG